MTANRAVPIAPREGSLSRAVVRFCRLLQHNGVAVAADGAPLALAALTVIDVTRRHDFRSALRVALLKRPDDFDTFNYLFNAYWSLPRRADTGTGAGVSPAPPDAAERYDASAEDATGVEAVDTAAPGDGGEFETLGLAPAPPDVSATDTPRPLAAAAVGPNLAVRADPVTFGQQELERVARALARELATRRSRRCAPATRGHRLDLRRVLRRSLRHGGLPIELRWRRPRPAPARLLIFCDVSRSMQSYASLLLRFAAAVLARAWHVEVFLFGTELARVTDTWRDRRWSELAEHEPACGGGTQIGHALMRFFAEYDRCLVGSGTIAVVLSDGLDAGDPRVLAEAMARLQRHTRAILWLNPLLRHPGYQPLARGMAAALPFVDVFAPAHDLVSLWRLVELLRGWPRTLTQP